MVNTDFTAAMSLLCYHFLKENRQLLNIHKYETEVVQLVDCYILIACLTLTLKIIAENKTITEWRLNTCIKEQETSAETLQIL